jgi:dihydropyrimidinase
VREEKERSLIDVVNEYHGEAKGNSYCDYGFHLIITGTLAGSTSWFVAPEPARLDKDLPELFAGGVTSCKLYMTYEALKLRDGELLDVMLATRKHNFTTMIHAENGEVVEWMTKKLEEKGMTEPYHHYTSRPSIVEAEATNRAISLSEIIQIPLLLVHVSAPVNYISSA